VKTTSCNQGDVEGDSVQVKRSTRWMLCVECERLWDVFIECVAKLDETSSSWREATQGQRRTCEDALEKLSQHKRSHNRNESFDTQARD
jgi:hypothetical protein